MKKTVPLSIASSERIPCGHFAIHPNEGFDLGMMTRSYAVQWCTELSLNDFIKGISGSTSEILVDLLNECPRETLQMNLSHWKKIGMPEKAIVIYDGNRLYVQPFHS